MSLLKLQQSIPERFSASKHRKIVISCTRHFQCYFIFHVIRIQSTIHALYHSLFIYIRFEYCILLFLEQGLNERPGGCHTIGFCALCQLHKPVHQVRQSILLHTIKQYSHQGPSIHAIVIQYSLTSLLLFFFYWSLIEEC